MSLREWYQRLANGRPRDGHDPIARDVRGNRYRLSLGAREGQAVARPSRVRPAGAWTGELEVTFEVESCIEALVLLLREGDAHRLRIVDEGGRVRVATRVSVAALDGAAASAGAAASGAPLETALPAVPDVVSGNITAATAVAPMPLPGSAPAHRSTLPLAQRPVVARAPHLRLVPPPSRSEDQTADLPPDEVTPPALPLSWARSGDAPRPGQQLGELHFINGSALVGLAHDLLEPHRSFLERHGVIRDHAELLRAEAPASRGGGIVLQIRPADGVVALRERDAWVEVTSPRQVALGQEFSLGDCGFALGPDGELEFTRVVKHQARAQSALFQRSHLIRGHLHDGLSLFGRNVALEGHLTLPIPVAGSQQEREIIVWDLVADERVRRLLQLAVTRADDPVLRAGPGRDPVAFERALERALRTLRDVAHGEFHMPRRDRARANLKKRLPGWRGRRVLVGEVLGADAAFCSHLSLLAQAFLVELGLGQVELRRGHGPGGEPHQWNQIAIGGEVRVIEFSSYYYCAVASPLVASEACRAYRPEPASDEPIAIR